MHTQEEQGAINSEKCPERNNAVIEAKRKKKEEKKSNHNEI